MQRKLRRYENHLIVIGGGIATLGVWNIIKALVMMISNRQYMQSLWDDITEVYGEPLLFKVIFFAIFFIVAFFILGIYFYIGFSARAEGFGKRSGWLYLVLTIISVTFSVYVLKVNISDFDEYYSSVSDGVVAVFIECTTVVTMCELIFSSVMVKILRHKIKTQEAA